MRFLFNVILLFHPNLKVKSSAAMSLGKNRNSLAVWPLKYNLNKDSNTPIVEVLAWAIASIGTQRSVQVLTDALDSNHNSAKQYYAAICLEQLIGSSDSFFSQLEDAIYIICVHGSEHDVETVIKYLQDARFPEGFVKNIVSAISALLSRVARNVEVNILESIVEKNDIIRSIYYGATTTRYSDISIVNIKSLAANGLTQRKS